MYLVYGVQPLSLRRFTTKKPESPTPVVVVPPDIAHPAALALQTAARGMTARRLRTELAEGSRAALKCERLTGATDVARERLGQAEQQADDLRAQLA